MNNRLKAVQAKYELRISTFTKEQKSFSCLVLIDENNGGKSLTNDMENVLNEVYSALTKEYVKQLPIIYRDSRGKYDGVEYTNNILEFIHLDCKNQEEAMIRMKIHQMEKSA